MKNLLLKTTCMLVALLCVNISSAQDLWDRLSVATSFHAGEGTEDNPYQIRTAAELMYFVHLVNTGDNFSGKTVKLMNDIDLNNDNFSISKTFAGTFDGGGHFITIMMGVSSDNQPFTDVTGRIHHLGVIISMKNQYNGVYYGYISIVRNLKEGGILEDIHYTVNNSADIFSYQPALAYNNYGIIRNCYAGGSFHTYGGYEHTDGSLLVRDNYETGVIENCYAYVNRGMTNYYYKALPLAYTDKGTIIHNSTNIDELNQWVNEHPGHSAWTNADKYKLVDFNPSSECTIEFVDTLFSTFTPTLTVARGRAIGKLPTPDADCTLTGWVKTGKIVRDSDVVDANWTLFAKWEQRIKRQPTIRNMSVGVDDIAHASFQWFANSGQTQYFADVLLKCTSDDSYTETIDILATAGQTLHFDYVVSSEKDYDVFSASIDGQSLVTASGEKHGNISYVFPTDGTYKLSLRYSKDDSTSDGLDMAKVTNIRISNTDDEIECKVNRLPVSLVEKESNYFCKICYSNTGIVLYTDTIHCIPGEMREYAPYELYVTDLEALVNTKIVFPIELNNEDEVKLCQFDLRLPEGVTVATKSNGTLDACLTERAKSHSLSARRLSNGDYRFIISSLDNDSFTGNEGTLMNISLEVTAAMEAGEYTIKVLNAELSVADGNDLMVVRPADTESKLTVKAYTPGDVNSDGTVSVTDAGCAINYILEQVPSVFVFEAADMNQDKSVSVTDVGMIINLILNEWAASRRTEQQAVKNAQLSLMAVADGYDFWLENKEEFVGFQMDVVLAGDGNINDVRLAGGSVSDHLLACRQLSDGKWRVVCYSPTNSKFSANGAALLTFGTQGNASISNIRLTTAGLDELCPADIVSTPTGIAGVSREMEISVQDGRLCINSDREVTLPLYALDGRVSRKLYVKKGANRFDGLRNGIYMINNKKIILR